MKKNNLSFFATAAVALLCVILAACGSNPAPIPPSDELDAAIRETSDYLNKQLPKGNKLVILNVQSEFPALSEYIIDELIANTVNDRAFSVVDRQQLNTIREELDFQMSGEVDDATAQALGRMAGAQIIISGAVSRIGDLYRLRIRALSVQSAEIVGQFNRNIPDNPTVAALVKSEATGYGGSTAMASNVGTKTPTQSPALTPTVTPVPVQTVPAQTPTPTPTPIPASVTPTTYIIGDIGPGGGIVFYDKGNNTDSWQYMEVSSSTVGKADWGADQAVTTDTAIGTGKRNTLILLDVLRSRGESGKAAQLCAEYRGGGFNDWFLPSKDELNAIYTSLVKSYLVIDLGQTGWLDTYWTSSQNSAGASWAYGTAWIQQFSSGNQNNSSKPHSHSVRAVRQF